MNAASPEPTRRENLAGLLADIAALETLFGDWDEDRRGAAEAFRRALDALHGEALRRLIRALKMNPHALAALKEAARDEVVYAVLRRHELIKPSMNERIEAALETIRPLLRSHGGDVSVETIGPPRIEIRFSGACNGCAASALTFQAGVRKAVQDACPEITEIIQVKGTAPDLAQAGFASPFGLNTEGEWRTACAFDDLAEGELRALTIGGQDVVLFRRGEAVTCFENACGHLGSPIDAGAIEGRIISCPRHGFRYDLANGACLTTPEVRLRARAVRIVGERVEVRIAA
jgi:nitrite reductase/ring-hydroxylating ferredoxin subunit/Fe-S cluster biogenesis protein NfuA